MAMPMDMDALWNAMGSVRALNQLVSSSAFRLGGQGAAEIAVALRTIEDSVRSMRRLAQDDQHVHSGSSPAVSSASAAAELSVLDQFLCGIRELRETVERGGDTGAGDGSAAETRPRAESGSIAGFRNSELASAGGPS